MIAESICAWQCALQCIIQKVSSCKSQAWFLLQSRSRIIPQLFQLFSSPQKLITNHWIIPHQRKVTKLPRYFELLPNILLDFKKKKLSHLWKTTPLTIHLLTIPLNQTTCTVVSATGGEAVGGGGDSASRPGRKVQSSSPTPPNSPNVKWLKKVNIQNHHISLHYLKCHFLGGGKDICDVWLVPERQ